MTTTDVADAQLLSRDRKVIATLLVATFVVILNETIMGVALPVLMVDLDLTAGTVQWLTTAFMLTMAVVIPTTGFLLQRFSTRTVYGAALGLFSAGTLLGRARAGLLGAAARSDRPGVGYGDHAAAADDHDPDAGADPAPRGGDGQRQHRHRGGAGDRPDAVRSHPAVPALAVPVPAGAADLPGGPGLRPAHPGERERRRRPAARHPVGAPLGAGLRRHRLRAEPARGVQRFVRLGRAPLAGRRSGVPGAVRVPAARPRHRQGSAARSARLRPHDVPAGCGAALHRRRRAVRGDHPAAHLLPERPWPQHARDRLAAAARWSADGSAGAGGGSAVRQVRSPRGCPRRVRRCWC